MILLIILGVLVNGPYALITTAVSAELGTHSSLEGNSKALATVTAIIDGTGSIGTVINPTTTTTTKPNYYFRCCSRTTISRIRERIWLAQRVLHANNFRHFSINFIITTV